MPNQKIALVLLRLSREFNASVWIMFLGSNPKENTASQRHYYISQLLTMISQFKDYVAKMFRDLSKSVNLT